MSRANLSRRLGRIAATAITVASLGLVGCASTAGVNQAGLYADPLGKAPVTSNDTAYSDALICLAGYARQYHLGSPSIAVGRISDFTGKQEEFQSGPKLTQGASLMAITALAKGGARMVERYDTSVNELELKYANSKLISDPNQKAGDYRLIRPGEMSGSNYILLGGITELNYNIRSSGGDLAVGGTGAKEPKGQVRNRSYVMNVGVDLRLVDTRTSEVVDVISYQKQIYGRELSAGMFSFLGDSVIDLSGGTGGLEPMQLAVRAVIERGVLEMLSGLYGAPSPAVCLDPANDPLSTQSAKARLAQAAPPVYRQTTQSAPYGRR